jgi:integrase/recombinase XerC
MVISEHKSLESGLGGRRDRRISTRGDAMNKRPPPRISTTELARIQAPTPAQPSQGVDDVLKAFLDRRNPRTLRAYDRDLADFAWFCRASDARAAVAMLLDLPHGRANQLALAYKANMEKRPRPDKPKRPDGTAEIGLASATIARRLAALRACVKMARTLGVVWWALEVTNPEVVAYRETKGPGAKGWRAMVEKARDHVEKARARVEKARARVENVCEIDRAENGLKRAIRDMAVLRTLHDLALRRGELVAIGLVDLDLDAEPPTVAIVGKGRTDKEPLTLPPRTRDALVAWLAVRGKEPGMLFTRCDNAAPDDSAPGPLAGSSVFRLVRDLGKAAGLAKPTRPHGLRHAAITSAVTKFKGDYRRVKGFSRHANVQTVLRYDDKAKDESGEVAKAVSEDEDEDD